MCETQKNWRIWLVCCNFARQQYYTVAGEDISTCREIAKRKLDPALSRECAWGIYYRQDAESVCDLLTKIEQTNVDNLNLSIEPHLKELRRLSILN